MEPTSTGPAPPFARSAAAGVERRVSLLYEGTLDAEAIRRLAARSFALSSCCYFDTANVVTRAMDTATELRGLGELVKRVHLKDARAKVGDCPPGLGRVDFASTARALDEIGYEGWIVLETPPGPPELSAATSPSHGRSCPASSGRRRGRGSASSRARPLTGTR